MSEWYVYIMASGRNGTLYVGATNDLRGRVGRHKAGTGTDFTKRYRVNKLVYYKRQASKGKAISQERQIKKWDRQWKMRLIEEVNPEWEDLYEQIE